jgi:hypothetical protein
MTKRTVYAQLSNDLTAAIDTGNQAEADLTVKLAHEALQNGDISIIQMGDIEADYDAAF